MKTDRRALLGGGIAMAGYGWAGSTLFAALPANAAIVRPEDFGAKGDGIANDSDAFAAMSDHVNRRGGATIELRRTTYRVGRQLAALGSGGWAFSPARIMDFSNLRLPLIIRGNGARLKCTPGLRYGTFDRLSGRAVTRAMPNFRQEDLATPYRAMIHIVGCQAPIEISDIELDGSLAELIIGGPYGDTGYQIPAIGLFLQSNRSTETVRNLHVHHHGQDGIEIDGVVGRSVRSRFENVVSEYNGRQGVSLIGGQGYDFVRCKFNHTGRSAVASAPGAGVDIEAEGGKTVRDLTFTGCEFSNNSGCGLVADSGDSEGAVFTGCSFIGTTIWSAWPYKPGFVFRNCTFVGTLVHAFPHANPRRATQFYDCRFRDDPRLSPNGKVYLGGKRSHSVVDLAESQNVAFTRCSFLLTHGGLLPWSWRALYTDCTMVQAASGHAYPKGKYFGRNTIKAPVDLYGTVVVGSLTLNGKPLAQGVHGGPAW